MVAANSITTANGAPPTLHSALAPGKIALLDQTTSEQSVDPLFQPVQLGRFDLAHRMVYAPLTRCRALGTVPQPYMAEYYAQRATRGGLLIAEATVAAANGHGYPHTPGLHTQEQVEAWKPVVQAVHDKGAIFFNQIWHVGRASHASFQPAGEQVVGPSPIAIKPAESMVWTGTEMAEHPVPQPLDHDGIKQHIAHYATAARNAIEAGFDGVEIHGANGYLIDQFTKSSSNSRTDEYGGSIENRCRFCLEVVAAVVEAVGADRVGLRLSPFSTFLGAVEHNPYATFSYLVEQLNRHDLAYVHMVEDRADGNEVKEQALHSLLPFRMIWKGTFLAAGGYKAKTGAAAVQSGHADLIVYGRWWLANPDLPRRFQLGAPLNKYDRNTFYTQGMEGYLDYPLLEASQQQ